MQMLLREAQQRDTSVCVYVYVYAYLDGLPMVMFCLILVFQTFFYSFNALFFDIVQQKELGKMGAGNIFAKPEKMVLH